MFHKHYILISILINELSIWSPVNQLPRVFYTGKELTMAALSAPYLYKRHLSTEELFTTARTKELSKGTRLWIYTRLEGDHGQAARLEVIHKWNKQKITVNLPRTEILRCPPAQESTLQAGWTSEGFRGGLGVDKTRIKLFGIRFGGGCCLWLHKHCPHCQTWRWNHLVWNLLETRQTEYHKQLWAKPTHDLATV